MIEKADGFKLPSSVLKGKREVLSALVRQVIDTGLQARKGLESRWAVLEKMYRMEKNSSGSEVFEDAETRTTPLLHSRIKRLSDTTHGALTVVSPHCQAIPYDQSQKGADVLEGAVQATLDAEEFGEYQRLALKDAALCGLGVLWLPLKEGKGVEVTHVHPGTFFCLPNISHDMRRLYAMGHMSKVPLYKLNELKAAGTIYKDADIIPDQSADVSDGASSENTVTLTDDGELPLDYQLVEVWNVLLYCQIGKRVGWWALMFAEGSSQVISCDEYDYLRPWYAIYRIHLEPSRFWPESPVANNLQSLQHMHSTLSAVLEQGGAASTVGFLILNGVLENGKKLTKIKPGMVVQQTQVGAGIGAQAVFPAIKIGDIPGILQKVEQDADAAVSIGRIATSQELNDATATEVQALQASQAQAENTYASVASGGIESVFAIVDQYWKRSYDVMQKCYGHRLDLDELLDSLEIDVEWKAAGRAPDASPAVQMQRLQALYQMAQNPMSVLSPQAVEERIIKEMGIGDVDSLKKENQDEARRSAGGPELVGAPNPEAMAAVPQGPQGAMPAQLEQGGPMQAGPDSQFAGPDSGL